MQRQLLKISRLLRRNILVKKSNSLGSRVLSIFKPFINFARKISTALKPFLSVFSRALRPITRKLSPLPHLALIAAILTPLLSTVFLELHNSRLYKVVEPEKVLLSKTSVKKDLIKDTEDSFLYNRKEELNIPNGDDPKLQELLLSANKAESTGKEPYQAKLSKNPREGITFGDAEGNRQFTITPDYGLSTGRLDEDSRIIYPKSTTERHIYTFKKNGIKNDITLLEAPTPDPNTNNSTKTYAYTLDLGNDLEARQLPTGDIGIYSADPTLFGNIQVGDEKSQELIDKARANNQKNTLAFEIPRPFIIDATKKKNYDDVSFKLNPNQQDPSKPTLTLEVRNLQNLPYPVSVDPTITVTSTADFQTDISKTGNIDESVSGQINRSINGGVAIDLTVPSITYATGGTPSNFTGNGTNGTNGRQYRVHTFSTVGTSTFTVNQTIEIEYLVVGGGGGGGSQNLSQGGGGAGGYKTNVGSSLVTLTPGTYTIIVGSGGAGGGVGAAGSQGSSGSGSAIQTVVSVSGGGGGGAGSASNTNVIRTGLNGASGGGAGHYDGTGGTAVSGEGNAGGNSPSTVSTGGGGGGGAGAAGAPGSGSNGGNGGVGLQSFINGSGTFYAGGGGGSRYTSTGTSGTGGNGGGGGAGTNSAGTNGTNGLGGGGGAGNGDVLANCCSGGAGGSGVVVIRYPDLYDSFTSFTAPNNSTSFARDGYLYIIGGDNGAVTPTYYNTIQRCLILSSNKTLDPCTQLTTFTGGRTAHTSLLHNGYLYIIGGRDGSTYFNDIQYCKVNANGTIDPCVRQENAFSIGRKGHSSAVYNGNIYIVGGRDGSNYYNDIYACKIKADNSVGTCTRKTSAFTLAREEHDSVVYNGYLYIVGGTTGTPQNDVHYCVLNNDGTVGTCTRQTTAFVGGAREGITTHVRDGYLYIVGGTTGSYQNDIHFCPFNDSGRIGYCSRQTGIFKTARAYHTSAIYDNTLYIVGGWNGSLVNDIQYRPIVAGGRAAPSISNAGSLTGTRSGHASVVYGNRLYVIGGWNGSTYYNDIHYCSIDTFNGALTCTQQTNAFIGPRRGHTAVAFNGFLYIIGGQVPNGGIIREITWCTINSNGTISGCSAPTGGSLNYFVGDGANGTTAGRLYTVHQFNNVGSETFNTNGSTVSTEYLIVGGGGGGGGSGYTSSSTDFASGGGGAGGLLHTIGSPASFSGSYTVTVGSGGSGGYASSSQAGNYLATNGTSSSISGVATAIGGGAGAREYAAGNSGGSGGGGAFCNGGGGAGTAGQGNNGGSGSCDTTETAGGGGGIGGGGGVGGTSGNAAGAGGSGVNLNITGLGAESYSGGGGGGAAGTGGGAGSFGGGGGGAGGNGGSATTYGSGGGGSGTTGSQALFGGNGFQGRVVVRYTLPTSNTTTFTTGRIEHTSFAYDGFIYIVGGWTGTDSTQSVERCVINTNGSIGACTNQATALTVKRHAHSTVLLGNKFYVIGGETSGSGNRNDIGQCAINNADGVVTCSTPTSNAFTGARRNHGSVLFNGYLYIIGGTSGTHRTNTVYNEVLSCPISTTGVISACVSQTGLFSTPRAIFTAVEYNGYVYAPGGWSGTADQNSIEYLRLGPSEQSFVSSNTTNASHIYYPRREHGTVAYKGYMYITGGYINFFEADCKDTGVSSNYCNDIRACPINSDGSIGACDNKGYFTSPRSGHTSLIHNGYLYVVGGWNGTTYYDNIQICPITNPSNGTVGACTSETYNSRARTNHTSVIFNDYLYIIGGVSSVGYENDIQRCPINLDGSLENCTTQNSAFTTARSRHASTVFNRYLYIVGGWNGTSFYDDIQYCPINTDGSIGTCIQQNVAFRTPRNGHTIFANNKFLYILGGLASGSAYQNDLQQCEIKIDGSVDSCNLQTTNAFTTGRTLFGATFYNLKVYITGGLVSSSSTGCKTTGIPENHCSDIQYITIDPLNMNTARYERILDTGSANNTLFNLNIQGDSSCNYSVYYETAGSDNNFGSGVTLTDIFPGRNIAVNAINTRYIRVLVTLDDSQCGTVSNITQITLNYNEKPSIPTTTMPLNSAISVSTFPEFRLGSSDTESDYLRYKIEVCTDSACNNVLRTIDQTASQAGWTGQTQEGDTAYAGGTSIVEYAKHTYQLPILETSSTYYWRAYAIDPNGSNTWSYPTEIYSFSTVPTRPVSITGNTIIQGGSIISP